jgi:hypothetical protein
VGKVKRDNGINPANISKWLGTTLHPHSGLRKSRRLDDKKVREALKSSEKKDTARAAMSPEQKESYMNALVATGILNTVRKRGKRSKEINNDAERRVTKLNVKTFGFR